MDHCIDSFNYSLDKYLNEYLFILKINISFLNLLKNYSEIKKSSNFLVGKYFKPGFLNNFKKDSY